MKIRIPHLQEKPLAELEDSVKSHVLAAFEEVADEAWIEQLVCALQTKLSRRTQRAIRVTAWISAVGFLSPLVLFIAFLVSPFWRVTTSFMTIAPHALALKSGALPLLGGLALIAFCVLLTLFAVRLVRVST
ncbi:hypothetical protein [Ferroacidibacillus organovorans]|uniref:Uncharacterized protein n=1 Tax=Ferroacidibacillus organovorans TaxID=1765683 RepID=A0A162TRP4_9BACL|nr:hypothetical protein [Ferroacidibacillus organovorans]KYP81062.1 hypothetical protein AYJ22_09025 [Ferroacidibacillus organovorans]OAG93690.1 hypothetical protein AYW79_09285 [Ferroacidibacillus organovorans]OPG17489.1 hypothetical protein B2M26_01815 [Ferroacidibacillus organovorans]